MNLASRECVVSCCAWGTRIVSFSQGNLLRELAQRFCAEKLAQGAYIAQKDSASSVPKQKRGYFAVRSDIILPTTE